MKKKPPVVLDAKEVADTIRSLPNRQCPVCLRETLGWRSAYPPKEGNCLLCDVRPDSEESRERVKLYLKEQARMFALVPKARR